MLKLEAHGIGGLVSNWIKSWLAETWQQVIVDGSHFQWKEVWCGVLQGSILGQVGPVLFLIFINDLDWDTSSRELKFADDTKLYCPVNNQVNSRPIHLQKDLALVVSCGMGFLLANAFHWQKNIRWSSLIHFGKEKLSFTYSMEGHCLENVDCEKDLGVVTSKDLKVTQQCQESYSKANWY